MLTANQYISPALTTWLLVPVAILALGRLAYVLVRWLRADTETRISDGLHVSVSDRSSF